MCLAKMRSTILLFVVGTTVSYGAVLPFVATLTQHRELIDNSSTKPPRYQDVEETIYRTSDGTQLQRLVVHEGGQVVEDRGILRDVRAGQVYVIDYRARTVRQEMTPVMRPDAPHSPGAEKAKVESVDGMRCNLYPVFLLGKRVGESWISIDYGIDVKQNLTIPAEGKTTVIHMDLQKLVPGEPSKGVFVVDPAFKRITKK